MVEVRVEVPHSLAVLFFPEQRALDSDIGRDEMSHSFMHFRNAVRQAPNHGAV